MVCTNSAWNTSHFIQSLIFFMDNQSNLFALRINENTKTQLRGAAVVAGVAAIFSLVGTILNVVMSFMNKGKTVTRSEGFGESRMAVESGGNIISTIIGLGISILLFYFLNKFASQTKTGLNGNNPELVSSGLGGLSSYFITFGIIMILLLVLVLVLIAGLGAGSR